MHHHPAVREALVIGLPDAYRGERPRAYVTLEAAAAETAEGLRDWLNPQLGRHERVDEVVVREGLPRTMIGKLSRKDLLAEVTARDAAGTAGGGDDAARARGTIPDVATRHRLR